jgi:glycosyltransferase involved in cell wall biosynthesis
MISELSIIIPTLNEEHYLPKLLTSLVNQHFSGKLQIIVVDGGSTDKTIEKAKEFSKSFGELLILKTHKGIGHQRNKGAERARYNHLLFIDADIIIPKGMLNAYLKNVDPHKRLVGRTMLWPTNSSSFLEYLFFVPSYLSLLVLELISPVTSGGFLLSTKDNWQKIGGFREEGLMGEDVDFGERSIKAGAEFYTSKFSYVLHSSRRARQTGVFKLFFLYIRSYLYFRKYGIIPNNGKFVYPYGEYKEYY